MKLKMLLINRGNTAAAAANSVRTLDTRPDRFNEQSLLQPPIVIKARQIDNHDFKVREQLGIVQTTAEERGRPWKNLIEYQLR